MFNAIFLGIFTLSLNIANVYLFIKKKYLYIFFPCLLFLPVYYGVEISDSLPIFSTTRIMYIILFIYTLKNKRRRIHLKSLFQKKIPREYLFIGGYFILRILSNLHYALSYSSSVKKLLLIIFEQLLLLISIYLLAPTKEEILKIIKIVVWTATVLFVIGILESIFSFRPFDALYTIFRDIYHIHYYRLGLLRATTTMFAPAVFGNMCILIMPLILFLYEKERSKKYLLISCLDILAAIHSGSRAAVLFLIVVGSAYFFYILKDKARRLLFIKNGAMIIVALLLYMTIASFCSPKLRYFYTGNVKSVLNEIGFNYDLAEDAPEGVDGFGGNIYGSASRIRQFTGIYYVVQRHPFFGMGADAPLRKDLQFFWHTDTNKNKWIDARSYDVGIVEIFCDEGLIGLLGMCSLIIFMFLKSKNNKQYLFLIFTYLLSTLETGNMFAFLMFYIIIISYHKSDII